MDRRVVAPHLVTVATWVAVATGVVVGAAALAACSNQQSSVNRRPHAGATTAAAPSTAGGVQQVLLTADDTDRFAPSTVTVHPGLVQIVLHDVGGAPHNWTLSGFAATPLTVAGQTRSVTFIAPAAGTYRFVCTIHERQGQTGTLVVLPS